MELMARYFNYRLRTVFAGVVDEPGVLWNSANNPLYLLSFAVGNERGKDIALLETLLPASMSPPPRWSNNRGGAEQVC